MTTPTRGAPQRQRPAAAMLAGTPFLIVLLSVVLVVSPGLSASASAAPTSDHQAATAASPSVTPATDPEDAATADRDAALSRWRGGVDLYRPGVFTTQKTWHWCTAANAQIMRNIVHAKSNHGKAQQRRFFRYMRAHARYDLPLRDGVDPVGWAAGLRHHVDPRYRLVSSGSFHKALRSAVRNLRRTNLPVGIAVARGNHAWVLTGFEATADPATTDRFRVTSVRVTGPLWGRQNRSFGYDMRPNTKLTRKQFKHFFTPWHYAPMRMVWEGRWVSVQPIPRREPSAREHRTTPATPPATWSLVWSWRPSAGPTTGPANFSTTARTPAPGPGAGLEG